MSATQAAVAAIEFALQDDDPVEFLHCWNEGNFDAIRREWPNAPEAVFIGTDPLHPETRRLMDLDKAEESSAAVSRQMTGAAVEGWQLVPTMPTVAMLIAGQEAWATRQRGAIEDCEEAAATYFAMLAAAPKREGE